MTWTPRLRGGLRRVAARGKHNVRLAGTAFLGLRVGTGDTVVVDREDCELNLDAGMGHE